MKNGYIIILDGFEEEEVKIDGGERSCGPQSRVTTVL